MDEITITLRAREGVDLEEAYSRLLEWLSHLGLEEVSTVPHMIPAPAAHHESNCIACVIIA